MVETPSASSVQPGRRLVNWLLGVGLVGWAGSLLYPVIRYLRPLADTGLGGPLKLSAEEVAKVDKESFAIVRAGTRKVLVFNAGGEVRAVDAKCTHEGCTVRYVAEESLVWCACHNGKFDLEGRVIAGPPPRPLAKWKAAREADGSVTVTPEKA